MIVSLVALWVDAPKDWALKAAIASAFTFGAWLLWLMSMRCVPVLLGVVLWLSIAAAAAIAMAYAVFKATWHRKTKQ